MSFTYIALFSVMAVVAFAFIAYPLSKTLRLTKSGFAYLPLLLVVAAIAVAVLLYATLGNPDAESAGPSIDYQAGKRSALESAAPPKTGSVASLLAGLETTVEENPDNAKDWLLLAKSYDFLDQPELAIEAYANATRLGMTDSMLEEKFATADYRQKGVATASIVGTLHASDDAAAQIHASDTIFLVARETGGSPVPLAVLKLPSDVFPIQFEIGDQHTMVAGREMSSVEEVYLDVKVSATGSASNSRSDLSATSESINLHGAAPIQLTLIVDVQTDSD